MKFSRIVKFIILIVAATYLIQNPVKVAEGRAWLTNKVQEWVVLLDTNNSNTGKSGTSGATQETVSTDDHGTTHLNGAIWPKKTLNVYFDTSEVNMPAYESTWQRAFDNWNAVKILTLVRVQNKNQADIVLTTEDISNTSQAGVAEAQFLVNPLNGKKVMTHVVAKLNVHYLNQYSETRKINTAEHELGHALGLDHETGRASVMQPQGADYGIQPSDINQLKTLYQS